MATTLPHAPIAPSDDLASEPSYIVDTLFWHCMLAMLVPLWTPVTNTATVTSFNFDESFKTVQRLQGRPTFKAQAENARSLVEAQAQYMAVEAQRAKERLAATEKERQKRDQERERQARKEVDAIGDFSL